MTSPNSLLVRADLASMFIEPMNTVFSSMTTDFACRLAFEPLKGWKRLRFCPSFGRTSDSSTPSFNNATR